MRMSTQFDLSQAGIGIHLMSGTELMMTNNLGVGDLLPPGLAEKVLCLDSRVSQKAWMRNHGHIVLSGHIIPSFEPDLGIVYRQRWSDDAAQTVPVLVNRN